MRTNKVKLCIGGFLAVVFALVYSIPLYVMLVNAFKPYADIVQKPLSLPLHFTINAFVTAYRESDIARLYLNTAVITVSSLAVLVLFSSMAAYILSRRRGLVYSIVYLFLLLGLMVPVQVILIPSIQTLKFFRLLHTFGGLILFNAAVYMGMSFFLYVEFFKTLPQSIEESAIVDGASRFTIYSRIMLPLLKPCTATVLIFNGMWIWNDFLPPLYILNEKTGSTITTGIYRAIGTKMTNWDTVFAVSLMATVPVLLLYILLQDQFVKGLAAGAIKG